jgi:hypothetical protein
MNKQGLTKADLLSKKPGELADLVISLASIIRQKDAEIETLKELQRLRTAERYVPSTEQMGYLFEELELLDSVLRNEVSETLEVTVSAHTKQVRKRLNACTAPSDTPVVDVYHDKDGVMRGEDSPYALEGRKLENLCSLVFKSNLMLNLTLELEEPKKLWAKRWEL